MSRRRKGRHLSGILLLDKPAGLTSNRALQTVRRAFDARKAGHTGTLDPFATGMLPVCLGEATKTTAFMLDADKAYRATAELGVATATGDPEGEVVERQDVPVLDDGHLQGVLDGFLGEIEQVPPMYSALKQDGRRLYELARQGIEVERAPRPVTIHRCRLIDWSAPHLTFEVVCSKGTYVRTLAEDIAARLNTCAHLVALRRLWVAPFTDHELVTLEQLEALDDTIARDALLLSPDAGLPEWPVLRVDAGQERAFTHGNACTIPAAPDGPVRVHADDGRVLGLGDCEEGRLAPRRVFVGEGA